jgi:hypothetical protein
MIKVIDVTFFRDIFKINEHYVNIVEERTCVSDGSPQVLFKILYILLTQIIPEFV